MNCHQWTRCRIREHLPPGEVHRIVALLERVAAASNTCGVEQQPGKNTLEYCPYLKIHGPSPLCAHRCYLHYLIFEENWP